MYIGLLPVSVSHVFRRPAAGLSQWEKITDDHRFFCSTVVTKINMGAIFSPQEADLPNSLTSKPTLFVTCLCLSNKLPSISPPSVHFGLTAADDTFQAQKLKQFIIITTSEASQAILFFNITSLSHSALRHLLFHCSFIDDVQSVASRINKVIL